MLHLWLQVRFAIPDVEPVGASAASEAHGGSPRIVLADPVHPRARLGSQLRADTPAKAVQLRMPQPPAMLLLG